jgi:parvulin-like peptidyl-prolyl isomerase
MQTLCRISSVVIAALSAFGLAGCGSSNSSPKPLSPRSFYPGDRRIQEDPRSEINQTADPSGVTFPRPKPQDPLPAPKVTPVTQPATQPAAQTSAAKLPPGQFQLIGSVVAEVNGTPIYANKILSLIHKPLDQKARELKPEPFRDYAAGLIQSQVQELINDEVLYAAAERAMTEDDKKTVEAITLDWRTRQLTQAGGSLQVARSKAAAEGDDFDELAKQQYHRNMIELYRYRKLTPRVQVTIDDMRRYYEKHKDEEFTLHQAARFRLLEVSIAKAGSADAALKKVTDLHTRATTGVTDFAAMCGNENDDTTLAKAKGDLGMKDKGSLPPPYDKVEAEVWALQPGQITNPIRSRDAFYLAKLEEVRPGHVRPFNEQPDGEKASVQDEIKNKLSKEQFRELTVEIDARLRQDAIVRTDQEMLNLCLAMAMQRYAAVAQDKVN